MQPPQNPYSGFPNPNEPVPPSNPGGNYPGAVPPRAPEISFDAISQAWTVLQPQLATYAGVTLIVLLAAAVFQGLQVAFTPQGSPGGPGAPGQSFSMAPLVIGLIGNLVNSFLSAGFFRMAINHLRTGSPDVGDVFSVADVFIHIIIASILMTIAMFLGFCLCIIPGLLLAGLFLFVNPLIVDRRMGAIDAIGTSFNTLKPHMWMALVFTIVVGLVASVGALACLIGLVVTVPLAVLSIAITYRNFFDNGSAPYNGGSYTPVAPIADPRI